MKRSTMVYQLGYFVGEYIYSNILPTLSTDELQSRKVIKVSEEEQLEYNKLTKLWYSNYETGGKPDVNWDNLTNYRIILHKKYLPNPLKCYVPKIKIGNIEQFKQGVIASLWNTDLCNYSLDPEHITINIEEHFTIIQLSLDKQ